MNAIVDEAHLWGRKACAHAHGTMAIKMAVKAGVASIEHGSFLDDEAIQAATTNAADLIGNPRIGVIRPGSYADIIAVTTDPLKDITVLEKVSFVMKGGTVYK